MARNKFVAKTCVRIGYVWTKKEWRKNGLASFITHHACKTQFEDDRIELLQLFADEANPTSNKIYKSIGFKEFIKCSMARLSLESDE